MNDTSTTDTTAASGANRLVSASHVSEISLEIITKLVSHEISADDLRSLMHRFSDEHPAGIVDELIEVLVMVAGLFEVRSRVATTTDLDLLLQRAIDISVAMTGAMRGTVFLIDSPKGEFYARALRGGNVEELRFPLTKGIAGHVLAAGEGLIINDPYNDSRFNPEIDKNTGFRTTSLVCAPIITRSGERIGVIQLLNKGDAGFTHEDLCLLQAIAMEASAAFQNAQVVEDLRVQKAEEHTLLEITTALARELHLEPLLSKVIEVTSMLLEAERSTLFLYDGENDQLWAQVAQGAGTTRIRIPAGAGIAGQVFKTGATINIPDAYADARFNPEVDKKSGYVTRSILCMPVVAKSGEHIGVMQVLNKRKGTFDQEDERRLAALAAQLAIAIENARLFDAVLDMKNYNESVLQSLTNGVVTLDIDHRIVKCNSSATRILQCTTEQLVGHDILAVFGGSNPWLVTSLEKITATDSSDQLVDQEFELAEGKKVSVNAAIIPLRNIKREPIGAMVVLEDITREKRIKTTMTRYMAKEVAEKLLAEGETKLGGQSLEATIFFSDIVGFTPLAERLGAQATVSMLNEYFGLMVDIVIAQGGILDKYIGDAIMAVFGAPFRSDQDPDRAVTSGLQMLRALREFNIRRAMEHQEPIGIGIGINTDHVLSGSIGSLKRMEYTVIGDGVNLASRLEALNRFYGSSLLISEFTFKKLSKRYLAREIDCIKVKGKSTPIGIYEVLDELDVGTHTADLCDAVGYFQEGLGLYRARNWDSAAQLFAQAFQARPGDAPSKVFIERCAYLRQHPPAETWDGVWVMKSK